MSKQNNLTDFLTDVADAIRQKKGTQAPINPQDFSSEIASIPTGGNNPLQDMLDRTSNTDGSNLFYTYSGIFKQLTYENLITLDFSNKYYTDTNSMFQGCASLTTIPQLNFSKVTNAVYMFSGCTSLTTIPQLNFSKVTIANYMFHDCTSLTTLDFSNIKTIGSLFAQNASSLSTLIIRNTTTLAKLINTNAFSNTPIASGTGYIYVTDDLVDSYKQATNWSTFASQIKGLSELSQGE